MIYGCENCNKCYNGCNKPFSEEYIEGGADKCKNFMEEQNDEIVVKNMEKKCNEIREYYSKQGIFI
jgi:hypothetical protein